MNVVRVALASPLPLLLQQVGEVIALGHEVGVFAFLVVELHDGATVTFLCQQQLLQHPSVRLLLLVLQTVQLRGNTSTLAINNMSHSNTSAHTVSQTISYGYAPIVLDGETLKHFHANCTFVQPFHSGTFSRVQ